MALVKSSAAARKENPDNSIVKQMTRTAVVIWDIIDKVALNSSRQSRRYYKQSLPSSGAIEFQLKRQNLDLDAGKGARPRSISRP
jgi:hypothetical protein